MATVTTITLVDDLDGKSKADETVEFGVGPDRFQIDLTAEHAEQLRASFAKYIEHGRRTGRTASRRSAARAASGSGPSTAHVRAWARGKGLDIPNRGRISRELVDQYEQEHAGQ